MIEEGKKKKRKIKFDWREQKTCDNCAMSLWIPARELSITWMDDPRYWKWTRLPDESDEVAELLNVCWLEILGRVESKKLLVKTSYSAYLVFKLNEHPKELKTAKGQLKFAGGAGNYPDAEEITVSFSECRKRGDGWMEMKLGELFNDVGGDDDCVVEAKLFEDGVWKSGLLVKGIELIPCLGYGKEVVSSYLRSKLSLILQEADEDPYIPSHIILRFRSIERKINSVCDQRSTASTLNNELVHLLYDLIDAVSDCRGLAHSRAASSNKMGFFIGRFSEFFFKNKMLRQLDGLETRLKNITIIPEEYTPAVRLLRTYPLSDSSQIIGFESYAVEIEGWLLEENMISNSGMIVNTAIGIVGSYGCGKTALAQKVFASPRIQDEFSLRIWVPLPLLMLKDRSGVDTGVRVLNYILKEMGVDIAQVADYNFIALLDKLQRELMGKRYLIVLDDAWRCDDFYDQFLSQGLPKGSGGAIIMTSRSEDVIRRTLGADKHLIRMDPNLSHEICLEILHKLVGPNHPLLKKIKDDLLRQFGGLPLALISLADVINTKLTEVIDEE